MLTLLGLDQMMSHLAPDLGVDLGTSTTPVMERGRGITIREPSFVAIDRRLQKVVAVGEKARKMDGRAPSHIDVVRPVRDGVIADFGMTEVLLKSILARTRQHGVFRPRILVGVPTDATEVESRAVAEATREAGARSVYTLPQPLVAAIGAGLPVHQARGCMVCDIGGGTTEVAVISLGGIIVSRCMRLAGDSLDRAIQSYLRRVHHLLVGERSAEELKIQAGAAEPLDDPIRVEVRGRDLHSGLPRSLEVNSDELSEVLEPHVSAMADLLRTTLEATPPDLVSQVAESGVTLCGGTAMLRRLDSYLSRATGVCCQTFADPASAVALGTERLFGDPALMKAVLEAHGCRRG